MSIFIDNPVLSREVKGRMRPRKFGSNKGALGIVLFIGLVIVFFYMRFMRSIAENTPQDSRDFFMEITYLMLTAIVFIAPSLSATAICVERQQMTWDLMTNTPLTGPQILIGKWIARQVPVALLILVGWPLIVATAAKGEMGLGIAIIAPLFLMLTGSFFSAIGLLCSFRASKTAAATGFALLLTALVCIGTFIVNQIALAYIGWQSPLAHNGTTALLWINPFYVYQMLIGLCSLHFAGLNETPYYTSSVIFSYVTFIIVSTILSLSYMISHYRSVARE